MSLTQELETCVSIPQEFRKKADALPSALRALLAAELAVGNAIGTYSAGFPTLIDAGLATASTDGAAGHCFSAPSDNGYFVLTGPVTTRPRESGRGLIYRNHGDYCSGSFTDKSGLFFILEPPPTPVRRAGIRAAHDAQPLRRPSIPADSSIGYLGDAARADDSCRPRYHNTMIPNLADPNTALGRFQRSMVIDYKKWHDGIGYDLKALADATSAERDAIELIILQRGIKDWRDVEALAALSTKLADNVLKAAIRHPDPEILLAVARYVWRLSPQTEPTRRC